LDGNVCGLNDAEGAIGMFKVSPYKMPRHTALTLIHEMIELRKIAIGT
jgi:hypothetical protein